MVPDDQNRNDRRSNDFAHSVDRPADWTLTPQMQAFEAALGNVRPQAAALDRDTLFFEAGRQSVFAERRHSWLLPVASNCFTALAAAVLVMVFLRPEAQVIVRTVEVPAAEMNSTVANSSKSATGNSDAPALVETGSSRSTPTAPLPKQFSTESSVAAAAALLMRRSNSDSPFSGSTPHSFRHESDRLLRELLSPESRLAQLNPSDASQRPASAPSIIAPAKPAVPYYQLRDELLNPQSI